MKTSLIVVLSIALAVLGVVVNVFAKQKDSKILWIIFVAICFYFGFIGMSLFSASGAENHTTQYVSGLTMDDLQFWGWIGGLVYAFVANFIARKIDGEEMFE